MNIVIVGGGTAGWLTALSLSNHKPEHTYTVIESPDIPTVGVGEGTTGHFRDLIRSCGINEIDFLKKTNATLKLGIYFKGWKDGEDEYYNPIDGSVTSSENLDVSIYQMHLWKYPIDESSICGFLNRRNKTTFNKDLSTIPLHAYHLDSHLTAQYIKEKTNVKTISANIKEVCVEDTNISKLILDDGTEIFSDLFLDCTGSEKVLMSKLNNQWRSYADYLPVNSAVTFSKPHDGKYEQVTKCEAMSSGWLWTIPKRDKFGMGYVYCDKYISDEDAIKELGEDVEIISKIKFNSGRLERPWMGNCIALGLSSSFLEPLQATSIHTLIVQLGLLAGRYLQETNNQSNIDSYNRFVNNMVDDFMQYVNMHYSGSGLGTEFWNNNTLTDQNKELIEIAKIRALYRDDFNNSYYGSAGSQLWMYTMMGMGHLPELEVDWTVQMKEHLETSDKNSKDMLTVQEFDKILSI